MVANIVYGILFVLEIICEQVEGSADSTGSYTLGNSINYGSSVDFTVYTDTIIIPDPQLSFSQDGTLDSISLAPAGVIRSFMIYILKPDPEQEFAYQIQHKSLTYSNTHVNWTETRYFSELIQVNLGDVVGFEFMDFNPFSCEVKMHCVPEYNGSRLYNASDGILNVDYLEVLEFAPSQNCWEMSYVLQVSYPQKSVGQEWNTWQEWSNNKNNQNSLGDDYSWSSWGSRDNSSNSWNSWSSWHQSNSWSSWNSQSSWNAWSTLKHEHEINWLALYISAPITGILVLIIIIISIALVVANANKKNVVDPRSNQVNRRRAEMGGHSRRSGSQSERIQMERLDYAMPCPWHGPRSPTSTCIYMDPPPPYSGPQPGKISLPSTGPVPIQNASITSEFRDETDIEPNDVEPGPSNGVQSLGAGLHTGGQITGDLVQEIEPTNFPMPYTDDLSSGEGVSSLVPPDPTTEDEVMNNPHIPGHGQGHDTLESDSLSPKSEEQREEIHGTMFPPPNVADSQTDHILVVQPADQNESTKGSGSSLHEPHQVETLAQPE